MEKSIRRNVLWKVIIAMVSAGAVLLLGMVAPPQAKALDNGLAKTPPMGWNSWNQVRCNGLSEKVVKQAADEIVDKGLQKAGYEYVVIDDCWQGGRSADGTLFADSARFPSGIDGIADYVHSKGLKLGIYSSPGKETCANYWDSYPIKGIASFGHEELDAETFAKWGVDYLKYDWCRADETDDTGTVTRPGAFALMRDKLEQTGRDIVYGISEYGETQPWEWAEPVANLWRTTQDIRPTWSSVRGIIEAQAPLADYSAHPGAWNDPDMLQVGNGDFETSLPENRSHFAMWSMLASPLFLGTDISQLSDGIVDIVANPGIIAIDQDPLGQQARLVSDENDLEVWARPLSNGDIAVALMNASSSSAAISTTLQEIGAESGNYIVQNVWSGSDIANSTGTITATVDKHDTQVLRLRKGTNPDLGGLFEVSGAKTVSLGTSDSVTVKVTNRSGAMASGVTLKLHSSDFASLGTTDFALPQIEDGASTSVKVPVSIGADASIGSHSITGSLTSFGTSGKPVETAVNLSITVVPQPPTADTYVSDLDLLEATTGWGTYHKDLSVEGNALTNQGKEWKKGLGTNAPSMTKAYLGGNCTRLVGAFGIDDEATAGSETYGHPSITGNILVDGKTAWSTSKTLGFDESEDFDLDITGAQYLQLVVDEVEDDAYDHSDWLGMKLTCAASQTSGEETGNNDSLPGENANGAEGQNGDQSSTNEESGTNNVSSADAVQPVSTILAKTGSSVWVALAAGIFIGVVGIVAMGIRRQSTEASEREK